MEGLGLVQVMHSYRVLLLGIEAARLRAKEQSSTEVRDECGNVHASSLRQDECPSRSHIFRTFGFSCPCVRVNQPPIFISEEGIPLIGPPPTLMRNWVNECLKRFEARSPRYEADDSEWDAKVPDAIRLEIAHTEIERRHELTC